MFKTVHPIFVRSFESHIKAMGIVLRFSQTRDAGFSKQNYYKKIDKNQRKNIKITKHHRQGGNLKKN